MKSLWDKTNIGKMKLKNRFFRGALWEELADEKGHLTPELSSIYEELAKGGVGTIITGYAFVTEDEQPNPRMIGIYNDSFIKEYKEFTNKIHDLGANIIMQIVYGGFMTTFNVGERTIWGPSTIQNEVTKTWAKEMTKDEIKYLVNAYSEAARRVKESGFDGVEIHGGHGYLLSQFLSPYYNKRTDEYGGNIENRGRIIFEIFQAMREKVGNDFPILIKLNSSDYIKEGGLSKEESLYVAKKLADLGIDAIEVTGGNESIQEVLDNNMGAARTKVVISKERESYFKDYATELAAAIDIPVILIGGNRHLDVMEDLLNNENIEYFTLSRPLTAEPDLINKWATGNLKNPKCVSCNQCYNTPGKRCILNIREAEKKNK
ncbi:NADH:flavin oxidoreductase [Clostridium botulinum]|uniref:NADH:flavin oxidoreductase n=1 Tax=Clostridium botulinum TaxID=1491 RepID=UPI00196861BF|nr:NADH:flavin oxidoreductase [Clostridium botulinum]MBN1075120.1 NADH:flavin oxidoreductase [Clostridium botulinum]